MNFGVKKREFLLDLNIFKIEFCEFFVKFKDLLKNKVKIHAKPEFYGRSPFCYEFDKALYLELNLWVVSEN